jgi:hypothetical protein
MRALSIPLIAALCACVHEPAVVTELPHPQVDPPTVAPPPEAPPQYLVSDVGHEAIPLGKDGVGAIVDGVRVIMNGPRARMAKDVADPALVGAHKIPAWMGGGFLFRSSQALYVADAFDAPMRPLVSFPNEIDDVRFAPKYLLVHAASGQLWPVDPKTGARVVASPVGVIDVAAVGDGRAIALTEFGQAWMSTDSGAKWTDVTSQLQGPTDELRLIDDNQLWFIAATGASARIDPGGRLAFIDKAPEVKPVTLRAKDPRWKSGEFPIRRALQAGAPEGERQAIIVSEGNVARVDVLNGDVLTFAPGKLPPDANCEAVRVPDDVIFACTRRNGSAFVASHVLTDKAPTYEVTFSTAGQFYASDDGGLAFGGSCTGSKTGAVVCVRNSTGGWAELELDPTAATADGGAPSIDVARWIPRADGGAYALVLAGTTPALWDARVGGAYRPLTGDPISNSSSRYHRYKGYGTKVIDRGWSVTPTGSVRGWADNGLSSFEIRTDGSVVASPFHFDVAQTAGQYALARAQGRLWQSTDRGATWAEVDSPPKGGGKSEVEINACSPLGCDLSHWYRIGWASTPPTPREDPPVAPGAARITPVPLPTLACKQSGAPKVDAVTRTNNSPEDLGLGNSKLPIASDSSDTQYIRTVFGHTTINPPHGEEGSSDRDEVASRMIVSGFQTDTGSGSHFTVLGPVKDPLQLRRPVGFVAPFDPTSLVRKASYGISDLVAAARGVGMTSSDILAEDPSMPTAVIPSLALDPLAPGDLAFATELGMVGVVRSTGRVKVTMRPAAQDTQWLVSAAAIAGDDLGLLEVDANGLSHVSRWSGSAIVSLFDVPAPARPELYPANPDALAVNAKGDVGIIRTPSGGEPPTASTPALLYQHGLPVTPLAAWSTITSADDPACKADTGFRANIQTVRSWIKLPPELTEPDVRMIARVKWSAQRVCLEAVEIRGPDQKAAILTRGDDPNEKAYSTQQVVETWVIAKLAGGQQAVRAGIAPGLEWRQPLTCPLQP